LSIFWDFNVVTNCEFSICYKIILIFYTRFKYLKIIIKLYSNSLPYYQFFFRLEIQKDEIDSLKATLKNTLKAKEEDLRTYAQMMEETKMVFLQACFIGGGNQNTRRQLPTCRKSLTNFIT
jgi:hypothetical protein